MSSAVVSRNNVAAGTFVIASILLAVAIAFVLGDIDLGEKKTYVIRFPDSVGVPGLQSGADVTFAGLSVGSVVGVSAYVDPSSTVGAARYMDVEVELNADLVLFEDAKGDLTPPLLGGVSRINIASAGVGADDELSPDGNGLLDDGEVMMGRLAPSILAQLGFTAEDAAKIRASIDDVSEITANAKETSGAFKRMAEVLEPEFGAGVDDGRGVLANLREFSENFNGEDGWSGRVDSIMANVDEVSGKAGGVIDDAQGAIASARGMLDDTSPRVARIMDNVEQVTERVRFESIDRANEMLERGSLALGSYNDLAGDVRAMISENRPSIDSTLVNVRQLTLKGRLMVEELRAQPWRVLDKPSEKELKREPLYEAARAYADAVGELRVASESLDVAVRNLENARNNGGDEVGAELMRLAQVVDQAYSRYEGAERRLLALLAE